MATITISPKFLAQLKEICLYLAEHRSAEFAQSFQENAFAEIEKLLPFPRRWQRVDLPRIGGEFRRIFQIFHEIDGEQILIHAIVDDRRRPPLFQPE